MTSTVSVLYSNLPDGASTAQNQEGIKTAIESTNNNQYLSQTISLTSGVVSNSNTKDTSGFQQFSIIVEETGSGSSFQIEWSTDEVNWYFPDFSSTTFSTTGVDGVSTQDIGTTSGLVKAKYMRVALYNAASSSTVKIIATLLH